jgi:hypothetical protein
VVGRVGVIDVDGRETAQRRGMTFEDRGNHDLKGIPDSSHLFAAMG